MRYVAGLALLVAVVAAVVAVVGLCLGLGRPTAGQAPRPHYQVVAADAKIIRLDTETGDMIAFVVGPPSLAPKEDFEQRYGKIEFIEIARSTGKELVQ